MSVKDENTKNVDMGCYLPKVEIENYIQSDAKKRREQGVFYVIPIWNNTYLNIWIFEIIPIDLSK